MTHQKRLPAPKHYPIPRKQQKYITTLTGSRSAQNALPAVIVLREVFGYADTTKEAKEIVNNGYLKRNGETVRNIQDGIGILDIVEITETGEAFRVIRKGDRLKFVPTEDTRTVGKIVGKDVEGDHYVYRLHNGENHSSKDDYSTGNTLLIGDAVEEVEFEEGATALITAGKHAGEAVEVEEINKRGVNKDTAKVTGESEIETQLENLVAIGDLDLGE